jgi:hypothetical protein
MSRRTYMLPLLMASAFVLTSAYSALAWGGRLHIDISRRAAQIAPDEMAAWREYRMLLADLSFRPDLWKEGDPSEGVRHFIDAESYQGIGLTNLPPDRARALQLLGNRSAGAHGTAPWVILDLQEKLTRAMRTNDWALAARIAGAQGHYVADLHQPLHTTVNYDGSSGEGAGVHLRWEVQMPVYHWRVAYLTVSKATYVSNVWPSVLEWAATAHERYPEILNADARAREISNGNVESRRYYNMLWELTQNIFIEQVNAAAEHLSGLWYTAWVNAGKPNIPPPPEKVSDASIWLEIERPLEPSAWPFFIVFVVAAILIVWLCARKDRAAHGAP